jgi:hypothetical protein
VDEIFGKHLISRRAFYAGQNGEPPPHYLDKEVQEFADRMYELGQKSVLVKIGNRLAQGGE